MSSDIGNPLHEYTHHLQQAMPRLDSLFDQLHRRHTTGEARVVVGGGPSELGREDSYIQKYQGRKYGVAEKPLEVLTMAIQQLFHPVWGKDHLTDMSGTPPRCWN